MALSKEYILGMIELYKKAYNSQQLKEVEQLIEEKRKQYVQWELEEYIDKYPKASKESIKNYKNILDKRITSIDLEDVLECYEKPWPDNKYRPIWVLNK